MQRSMEYPTQIVRMQAKIVDKEFTCDQVNDEIEKIFVNHISKELFAYNTLISCTYDPQTHLATEYEINSHFDPLNDSAITELNSYLQEYNGIDLLGTQLKIESARGLIIAMDIAAGTKKNMDQPSFVQYRQDHSQFFFKSNFEMRNQLLTDVQDQFFSNKSADIFPFLHRWVFPNAGVLYKIILRDSNYVELNPERIFLMEKTGDLFIPKLKMHFAHNCKEHDNHHCLQ
ncbi:MAG: hypothetical protein EPN84_06635 [Legionella sp.]|nr:MAG: hypothetical protein EPN84_06635 [Legionella sp.]